MCEFLAETRFEDLPEAAVDRARWVTLDSLGAVAGGSAEPEVRALTAKLAPNSSGKASVLGTALQADPARAAFLNGTGGTFLELDEGNQFCRGHPGIHAFPAALALAEQNALDGRAFVLALVLGYEVGARIGIGASLRMSMHPHGTWGTVGAAVTAAKLGGANAEQFKAAINVASTLGLGTSRQTMLQGGTVRNTFAGYSGQIGITVWDLVQSGFTGERDGLSTVWGSVLSEHWNPSAMTDELGTRYEIARNYFKRHACCRYNHAALDALAQIQTRQGLNAEDVASVQVDTYSLAAQLSDRSPTNTLGAKFSVPFAIASTLVHQSSGVASFTWDAVRNDAVRELAQRVEVREDPALTDMMPDYRPARVVVTLRDGTKLEAATRTNKGDTEDPYSGDDLVDKFHELAGRVWSHDVCVRALENSLRVETLTDMNELTAPLRG